MLYYDWCFCNVNLLFFLCVIFDVHRQTGHWCLTSIFSSPQDFKEFAEVLESVKTNGKIVAVASADAVAKANEKFPELLEVKNIL